MKKEFMWEAAKYIFFGVMTTVVNLIIYFLFVRLAGRQAYKAATVVAWIFAVAFAYVTNKLWVFDSKSWSKDVIPREAVTFVGGRLFSLALELVGLWLMIDIIGVGKYRFHVLNFEFYGEDAAKLVMQAVVIVVNYVLSKLLIFRKNGGQRL